MKTNVISTLFGLNLTLYLVTVVLYLTVYFGLMGQAVVGVVQLVTIIYLWFYYSQMSEKLRRRHLIFTLVTIVYLLLFLGTVRSGLFFYNAFLAILFYVLFPMLGLGLFGLFNLHALKKECEKKDA